MDKFGHAFTSYQLGIYGYNSFKWAGYDEITSILYGGMSGSIFLSAVEILDGFSSQWGASFGDFFANSAGSILFIGQQLIFDTQKINLKFSYFPSKIRVENKRLLGNNEIEAIFKDYNAQKYWLTFNLQETSVFLYHERDLHLTAFLFIIYTVIATFAYFNWKSKSFNA